MKSKSRPHHRSIRHSQFRDNTVIHQGDSHIHLPVRPARALTRVIPYPRNEDFINRSDIIGKLDELLPPSSDFHSAALCGLGGSGKFGGIDEKLDDEGLLTAVCNRIEEEPEWLLVLDNADDLSLFGVGMSSNSSKILPNIIPRGPKGLVLWTTRDKRIMGTLVGTFRAVEVGDMSLDEAKILLSIAAATTPDRATSEDVKNINKLLESLQYHALAISQAGAYMRRTSTSVQTWSISIKRIRQESELAYNLFHTIAYFDNQKFPGELVELAGIESGFDWEGETDELEEAITRLKEFSLIYQREKEYGHQMYEMHKLVQEAARYRLRMEKPSENSPTTRRTSDVLQDNKGGSEAKDESFFATRALNIIAYMSEDLHESGEAQVIGDDYLAHALQVVESMELCGEGAATMNKLSAISDLLGDLNEWKEKERLDERILTMRQKSLGVEHPDTLKTMAAIAITNFGQAFADRDPATLRFDVFYKWSNSEYYIEKAYEIGMEVLTLRQKALGPTHPDTIASWKIIVEVQCGQGRYGAATKIAQKILGIQRRVHGKTHPNTLAAMEDLAYVYYIHGRDKKALHIREKILKLQKERAGGKNLATMLAMYNLAISWNQCGRHRDALTLMNECYKLQEDVFGFFHRMGLGCSWYIGEWEDELTESDVQDVTHNSDGRSEEMAGVAMA
ncbi:hypothetical protein TrVFT333_002643 [Trichoderma virens FT-333]|nr:hypothetical protein TrVFT333_002643 [Trichoderma virens FT-333]